VLEGFLVRFDQQAKEGKKSFFVFVVFKSKNDEYHQKTMTGQNGVVTRFLPSLLGKSTLIGSVDSEERIFLVVLFYENIGFGRKK